MNMLRTVSIAIFSVATLAFVAGCSVARNQETVGQYVDGSAVTAQVKAKLAEDKRTSALNINVKTIDAGVVQLSGFAKSQQEKDVATQIARSVKGVSSVHNNLIVKP
ncbi:MAG: transporter [Comamonas sp. SCN 65-56]|uniref:BON domain-containing protein n=1 Tax=Comamonas sp. SCN 65-56 TaxID=1660095 RepID=UPI00086EA628|nr:BON domain-containing protein [Comamonas sp. SCN 65-56]ODS92776.1 MAG: transporter [Comamonas sp. SCN 65-56]